MSVSDDGAFARLPNNILHDIFDHLKPWELLCLARISERIQRVSLSIYYSRRSVDVSPTGVIDITREEDYDLLSLLRITTFFTKTGHISVVFVFPKWNLMENISNLTLILMRLVSVDMITLQFRFDSETSIEAEQRTTLLAAAAKSPANKGLPKALQTLFCTAFRVATLVRILESEQLFKMVGGNLNNNLTVLPNVPVFNEYKIAARVRMSKIAQLTYRKQEKTPTVRHESSIIMLDIRSLVLIVPPLLPWTVTCLNFLSKLQYLSFTTDPDDQISWGPLLSNLHIPSLVQLTMNSSSCTLYDLAKFCKHHLRMSVLDIRNFAPLPTEAPKVVNFAFRHLISVTAPSEVLNVFLSYPTEVVPMLKEAHFAINVTKAHPFNLPQAWRALVPVKQRLQSLNTFGLVVGFEAGESPFEKSLEAEERKQLVPLISVLTLRLNDDLGVNVFGQLIDWITEFAFIRELRLHSIYPYPYPIQAILTESAIGAEEEKKRRREAFRQQLISKLSVMEKLEACDLFGDRYP